MMDLTRPGGFGKENVSVVWGRFNGARGLGLFVHFAGNNDGKV